MQNWYYIENTVKDAEDLLHMFWEFHDFRIQSLSHNPKENTVDLVLEYDSAGLRVKLRFVDVCNFNFGPMSYGSGLLDYGCSAIRHGFKCSHMGS